MNNDIITPREIEFSIIAILLSIALMIAIIIVLFVRVHDLKIMFNNHIEVYHGKI